MIKLYPFQEEDVQRILTEFDARALIAWEMGAGKTICTLEVIKRGQLFPAIIVCPAGLKIQWQTEAREKYGIDADILSGKKPKGTAFLRDSKILIVNYEILRDWLWFLKSLYPRLIAADEVQRISSLRAKCTRAFRQLCSGVPHILGLSGTPLVNRPFELFSLLNILHPQEFPTPFVFGQRYCNAHFSFGSWQYPGGKNLKELHDRLTDLCMVRRLKKDVLPQLPSKRHLLQVVEIEDRPQYDKAEADLVAWLTEYKGLAAAKRAAKAEYYARFAYLKHLAAQLKIQAVLCWLDGYLQETDTKILIGTIHRDITDHIHSQFRDEAVKIDGSCSVRARQQAEQAFRKSKHCRILVGQIKAAGVGLNLPEASTVAFAEIPWTPGAMAQFIDRAHRLTSTQDSIDIYHLIAANTIERALLAIIRKKQKYLDQTLDGVASREGSSTVWEDLEKRLLGHDSH